MAALAVCAAAFSISACFEHVSNNNFPFLIVHWTLFCVVLSSNRRDLRQAIGDALKVILKDKFRSQEQEVKDKFRSQEQDDAIEIEPRQNTYHDKHGGIHQIFQQVFYGYPVEGAALAVHTNSKGEVLSVNGEYVEGRSITTKIGIRSKKALKIASEAYFKEKSYEIVTPAELTVVNDSEGNACFAWTAFVAYTGVNYKGFEQLCHAKVFADAKTGRPCALHPSPSFTDSLAKSEKRQLYRGKRPPEEEAATRTNPGTPSLATYDCHETGSKHCCTLVSHSSRKIDTGDYAIDCAHNFAYDTYMYYWQHFERDSIDGKGMTLTSYVHYNKDYNNAFWDGTSMTYGDGNGENFRPFSQGCDVVAHEITHGVTDHESNLIYLYESGGKTIM